MIWTMERIQTYRPLTIKEKILITLTKLRLFRIYELIKKLIKIGKSKKLKASIEKQLSDTDIKVLEQALNEGRQ